MRWVKILDTYNEEIAKRLTFLFRNKGYNVDWQKSKTHHTRHGVYIREHNDVTFRFFQIVFRFIKGSTGGYLIDFNGIKNNLPPRNEIYDDEDFQVYKYP